VFSFRLSLRWLFVVSLGALVVGSARSAMGLVRVARATGGPSTIPIHTWVPNGSVEALVRVGGTVYVGGDFTRISPPTGSGVVFASASGKQEPAWPTVTGTGYRGAVQAVAPDGAGGWYIGGNFDRVDGIPIHGLAHIRGDRSVDRAWRIPGMDDVRALVAFGSTLYVGGCFEGVAGGKTDFLLALNMHTRKPLSRQLRVGGCVEALAVSGPTVYIGGWFRRIEGGPRLALAAIDAESGRVREWDPRLRVDPCMTAKILGHGECDDSPQVEAIAVADGRVFVGGFFDHAGGGRRGGLAALDQGTGKAVLPTPKAELDIDGYRGVKALAVLGSKLYVGGRFARIGGRLRSGLAAVDLRSGRVTRWQPGQLGSVSALAVQGNRLYSAGQSLVAFDGQTGRRLGWSPDPNGDALALAATSSRLYVGGSFTGLGGVTRRSLAAINATSGRPMEWDPGLSGVSRAVVHAMTVSGGTLYVGGDFQRVGHVARASLAAFQLATGTLTSWNPDPVDGQVEAIAVSDSTVYLGGSFDKVAGKPRVRLAAIDASTGRLTDWRADADRFRDVLALALAGDTLYVGGEFEQLRGETREYLAAFETATGALRPWSPAADAPVWTLLVSGSTVYAGGAFDAIGGETRHALASLDAETGAVTDWNPSLSGKRTGVGGLALSGSTLYIGGEFEAVRGQARTNLAAIDTTTGAVSPWNPRLDGGVDEIAISGSTLYVGGDFLGVGGSPQSAFAVFSLSP
jgi:hypothetical protein